MRGRYLKKNILHVGYPMYARRTPVIIIFYSYWVDRYSRMTEKRKPGQPDVAYSIKRNEVWGLWMCVKRFSYCI